MVFVAGLSLAGCSGGSERRDASAAAGARAASLDTSRIPEDLRHLAPLAEEWGIGDDADRGEKVDNSTPEERAALRSALAPHHTRITAWLDSFGDGAAMTDEAAAFMYMQLALEEMPE
jgi:hypothetical protein